MDVNNPTHIFGHDLDEMNLETHLKVQLDDSQCSCNECDTIRCFTQKKHTPDEPDISSTCAVYSHQIHLRNTSKRLENTSDSSASTHEKAYLPTSKIEEEDFGELKNKNTSATRKNSDYIYKDKKPKDMNTHSTSICDFDDKISAEVHGKSTTYEYKHNNLNPGTDQLTTHIMNIPYKDFKRSLSSHRLDSSCGRLHRKSNVICGIVKKLQKVYEACNCKVCECLDIKSLSGNNYCKCEPCACKDCTSNKYCTGRDSIDYVNKQLCVDCGSSNCIDYSKTCTCMPCQCVQCRSLPLPNVHANTVALTKECQQSSCQCYPCNCVECQFNIFYPAFTNFVHEVSTEIMEYNNRTCENLIDRMFRDGDTSNYNRERADNPVRKSADSNIHDYDIHRASILRNTNGQRRNSNANDTIAMYSTISNSYVHLGVNEKTCSCDDCESIVCMHKRSILPIKHIRHIPKVSPLEQNNINTFCNYTSCERKNIHGQNIYDYRQTHYQRDDGCRNCCEMSNPPTGIEHNIAASLQDNGNFKIKEHRIFCDCELNVSQDQQLHNKYNLCNEIDYSKKQVSMSTYEELRFNSPEIIYNILPLQEKSVNQGSILYKDSKLIQNKESAEFMKMKQSIIKCKAHSQFEETNSRHRSQNNKVETFGSPTSMTTYLNENILPKQSQINKEVLSWENFCKGVDSDNLGTPKSTNEKYLKDIIKTHLSEALNLNSVNETLNTQASDYCCFKQRHGIISYEPKEYNKNMDMDYPYCHHNSIIGLMGKNIANGQMVKTEFKQQQVGSMNVFRESNFYSSYLKEPIIMLNSDKPFNKMENRNDHDCVSEEENTLLSKIDMTFNRAYNILQKAKAFSVQLTQLLEKYEKANRDFKSISQKYTMMQELDVDNYDIREKVSDIHLEVSNMERENFEFSSSNDITKLNNFTDEVVKSNSLLDVLNELQSNVLHYGFGSAKNDIKVGNEVHKTSDQRNYTDFVNIDKSQEDSFLNGDVKWRMIDLEHMKLYNHALRSNNNTVDQDVKYLDHIRRSQMTLKSLHLIGASSKNPRQNDVIGTSNNKYLCKPQQNMKSIQFLDSVDYEKSSSETSNIIKPEKCIYKESRAIDSDIMDSKIASEHLITTEFQNMFDNDKKRLDLKHLKEIKISTSTEVSEINCRNTESQVKDGNGSWSLFKKNNLYPEVKEGRHKGYRLPALENEIKEAVQSMSLEINNIVSKNSLYQNKVLNISKREINKICTSTQTCHLVTTKVDKEINTCDSTQVTNSCNQLKVTSLRLRRISDHTILVKWNIPRTVIGVRGYELQVDGRAIQQIFSPARKMAVITCLPRRDNMLFTIRTILSSATEPAQYPAATIVFHPRAR